MVPVVFRRINAAMARHPWVSAVTITSAKTTAADCFVQLYIENREVYDRRRGLVFFCFGFIYQGSCQYFMFNKVFEWISPTKTQTMRAALSKVGAANLICDPCFFFPTFYYLREALNTDDFTRRSFWNGLSRYKVNYLWDWTYSWSLWIPGHAVTFFVMPTHLRLPWMSLLSFLYCVIVSVTRGDRTAELEGRSVDELELSSDM